MDAISDFVNTITAYEITIPLSIKIIIIIILIISLCVGGYFMREVFDIESMRSGFSWFIFVAVLNLVSLLVIFLYYNTKEGSYKGQPGKTGKKGNMGKKGTSVSCNLCKSNLYIQTSKQSDIVCKLYSNPRAFNAIFNNKKYFDSIINKGNSIDYDSFVNSIILNQNSDGSNQEAINNFKSLMNTNSIAILLIKAINEITKAGELMYGTIRSPSVLQKYKPVGDSVYASIGDSVYGGTEESITLNSLMIAGNILYPQKYDKLVQFTAFNGATDAEEQYIIWRPVGQNTNETDSKGRPIKVQYNPLGDICRNASKPPKINEAPTISQKCTERVKIKDIQLIFIYVGNIQVNNDTIGTHSESYLIDGAPLNDIEVFSLWRTPLNTFITNCNSTNTLVNNTFIYNVYNINPNTDTDTPEDNDDATGDETGDVEDDEDNILTAYRTISARAKTKFKNLLSSIFIPSIITALILCEYYEIELKKDLSYYINYYKSKVPEFAYINTTASSLGDLMNLISTTKTQYDKNEKKLPDMILKIYNNANTKLLGISVELANTNSLLDVVNLVFDDGINTRIAINSDGIAQGGIFMNSIQELILRICKMLIPPNVPVYTIKDECLGTFPLDRDRAKVITKFTDAYSTFVKLSEDMVKLCLEDIENEKAGDCIELLFTVVNYLNNVDFKIGQLCNHINDYSNKMMDGNLEEFTTNRIKGLIEIFKESNSYLKNLLESSQ
jgi:hypothetical protein